MQSGNRQKLPWQEPCYALAPRMVLLYYADTGTTGALLLPWWAAALLFTSLHSVLHPVTKRVAFVVHVFSLIFRSVVPSSSEG